jgi:hypothetical protein
VQVRHRQGRHVPGTRDHRPRQGPTQPDDAHLLGLRSSPRAAPTTTPPSSRCRCGHRRPRRRSPPMASSTTA